VKGRNRIAIVLLVVLSLLLSMGAQVALADEGQAPPAEARPQPVVKFSGVVASRPEDTQVGLWVIGKQNVQVVEGTILDETNGPAEVGARVTVVAKRAVATSASAARLEAILIRVLNPPPPRPVVITGEVTELETTYLVVNEQKILYDMSTQIIGRLEVDARAKVKAVPTAAGLKALTIEVLPANDRIVEFEGVIESIERPTWVIGGRRVTLTARTVIIGRPDVGQTARVRAFVRANDELVALTIHVLNDEPRQVEWTGVIEYLPPNIAIYPPVYHGRWVVGGRSVLVNRETEIEGTPRIGLTAHVVALEYPNRPLAAIKIQVVSAETAETATAIPLAVMQ